MTDLNQQNLVGPSASADGLQVLIDNAAPTLLHTAVGGNDGDWDVVTIEVTNLNAATRVLTLYWGSTSVAKDRILQTIQPQTGVTVVIDRRRLRAGKSVWAQASAVDSLTAYVEVGRYSK